jgi:phage shock protein A
MKRALSVAAITTLSLLVFLFVGYAQEGAATSIAELLDQELAAMESAFGSLEAFMAELIGEVKGNMGDIDGFNAKADDLRDIVTAVAVEIKTAEGRIIGLRTDVNALGETQQELKVRIVALEAGLSELSTFVDELSARLMVTGADLGMLREEFDTLIADYAVFKEAFAAFQVSVYGDIDALRDSVYEDLDMLKTQVFGNIDTLSTTVYGEISGLQTGVYGDLDALRTGVYADLDLFKSDVYGQLTALEGGFAADISLLSITVDDLALRVQALEDEDVGTFKKKVIDIERNIAALAIRIDNNRAKLEGFDHAIASLSDEMAGTRDSVIAANQEVLAEYNSRLMALESVDMQSQIDTLYFISIVALLAGVGALIWGFFLGN